MSTLQVMANRFRRNSVTKFQLISSESMDEHFFEVDKLKTVLVDGEKSINQAKNMLNMLVEKNYSCSSNEGNVDVYNQIIENVCTCMNDELKRSISNLKSCIGDKFHENEVQGQNSFVELAIHRQQCFLDIVEDMTRTDNSIPLASIVAMMNNIIEQIKTTTQAQTDMNEIEAKAMLSSSPKSPILFFAGTRRKLEFDMLVAKPEILCCSKLPSCFKTSCKLNSGLASAANVPSGKIELPYCLELRTNTSVYFSDPKSSSYTDEYTNTYEMTQDAAETQELRAFHVEIHRCIHVALDENPEIESKKASIVGEITLLLSLSAIKSSTAGSDSNNDKFLRIAQGIIKRARATQINADVPEIGTALDLYTSSAIGDDKVTVSLRFRTRSCVNDECPNLLVELIV